MNGDRVKGTFDELVGSAKRMAGRLTGNRLLEAKGITQYGKGRFENALSRARQILHGTNRKATPKRSAPDLD